MRARISAARSSPRPERAATEMSSLTQRLRRSAPAAPATGLGGVAEVMARDQLRTTRGRGRELGLAAAGGRDPLPLRQDLGGVLRDLRLPLAQRHVERRREEDRRRGTHGDADEEREGQVAQGARAEPQGTDEEDP